MRRTNPGRYRQGAQSGWRSWQQLLADKECRRSIADEGKRLLRQMPRLKAQQRAAQGISAGLVDGDLTVAKFEARRAKSSTAIKLDPDVAEKFAKEVIKATHLLGEGMSAR